MKYGLDFINDNDLYKHIQDTVRKYRFKIDLKKLNDNLIDPIKLTFDSAIYKGDFSNKSLETILENEATRQIDKSNTNHIGYFHQNIFKYIGKDEGWEIPQKGFDIQNNRKKIYVEMKNKHNTMNSSSASKTYMRMQNRVLQDSESICMLVEIIAKNSQDIEWVCSIDGEKVKHKSIRRVSIDKFYEYVTGNKYAFAQLCKILPLVIRDVLKEEKKQIIQNNVLKDLKDKDIENILESLYLFTFRKYQGFEEFKLNK